MFPDNDIILGLKYLDFGVIHMLDKIMEWLFRQLKKGIDRRRQNLHDTRAGALASSFEPRLIWITMIDRPVADTIYLKKVRNLHGRFNEIMRSLIERERYMYYMKIVLPDDPQLYNTAGELSSAGQEAYWYEVNKLLRLFDRHDEELSAARETSVCSQTTRRTDDHDAHHSHQHKDQRVSAQPFHRFQY